MNIYELSTMNRPRNVQPDVAPYLSLQLAEVPSNLAAVHWLGQVVAWAERQAEVFLVGLNTKG